VGIVVYNNELFISEVGAGKISKIGLSNTNPVATNVLTGLTLPAFLSIYQTNLLVTENNKIGSFNLSSSNPNYNIVDTGLSSPFSTASDQNNFIYVALRSNGIIRYNAQNIQQAPISIFTGPSGLINGMVINGNDLYFATSGAATSGIFKLNLLQPANQPVNVISNQSVTGLKIDSNYLYYSSNNGIYRVDTTTSNPTAENVILNLTATAWGLEIVNTDLYAALQTDGKIIKIDLTTLSIDGYSNDNSPLQINIFPNPTKSLVNIKTTSQLEKIELYDAYGKLILEKHSNLTILNMEQLSAGIYFARFTSTENMVAVKQLVKK
jgi:hypothetical protein